MRSVCLMKREIFRVASSSRLARDLGVCLRDGALARNRIVIRARATARIVTRRKLICRASRSVRGLFFETRSFLPWTISVYRATARLPQAYQSDYRNPDLSVELRWGRKTISYHFVAGDCFFNSFFNCWFRGREIKFIIANNLPSRLKFIISFVDYRICTESAEHVR